MGRETKILLGLLGLLAGVFMGVLSMKLLVPRPPAGAGPDVHADLADTEPHDLVEPPARTFRADAFAAAPPLTPRPEAPPPVPAPDRIDHSAERTAAALQPPARRDPFVAPASFEEPAAAEAAPPPPTTAAAAPPAFVSAVDPTPPPAAAAPIAGGYVVRTGDSWWSVAERAYGDGRLYRALYAWNRAANPRLTLAPGTPLEIPPRDELAAAWPQLLPARP